jgi:hypothetical protein
MWIHDEVRDLASKNEPLQLNNWEPTRQAARQFVCYTTR